MSIFFFGFILSSCIALSQQPQQSINTSKKTVAASTSASEATASDITIKGCVQGSRPGHFTLFQVSTGAGFEIQDSNTDLKSFKGKLVVVTGTELAPTARSGTKSLPHVRVSSLRILEKECPIQGPGKRPDVSATGSGGGQNQPPVAATPRYQRSGAPNQTPPPAGVNPNGAGVSGAPSAGTGNPPQ
jgi:hypothetical protein